MKILHTMMAVALVNFGMFQSVLAQHTECILKDPSGAYTGPVQPPIQAPDKRIRGAEVAIYLDLDTCKVLGVSSLDPQKAYKIDWIDPNPNNMCGGNPRCYPVTTFGITYCRC